MEAKFEDGRDPSKGAGNRKVGSRKEAVRPHSSAPTHICFTLQIAVTQFQSLCPLCSHLVCLSVKSDFQKLAQNIRGELFHIF